MLRRTLTPSLGRQRHRSALAAITLATVSTVVLGACSSSNNAGGGAGTPSGPPQTLTVALATPVISGSEVPLGIELGYFQAENLTVKVINGLGANVVNSVVSGQADLGFYSLAGSALPAVNGKATTGFYGGIGGGLAAMLVGRPGINSLDDLKKVKNCTIAALAPGSSNYGYSQYYNDSLGLGCKLVSFTRDTEQVGAVVAGRADAAGGTPDVYTDLIPQSKVNVLIDGRDPTVRKQYLGDPIVEVMYFGLTDNLQKKRDAIVRFIKALNKVDKAIQSQDPGSLATTLHKNTDFQTTTVDNLTTQFKNDRQFFTPYNGYISQSTWDTSLQRMSKWGIPGLDPSASAFAYSARVDMSYYTAALGAPPSS